MASSSPTKQNPMANGGVDAKEHFLRLPQLLPMIAGGFTYDTAIKYLQRAIVIAQEQPFQWMAIDKPNDNDLYLVFHSGQPQVPWPQDGLRYLEQESRFTANLSSCELEVKETKYGFIPGIGELHANRIRRKFRLLKGGFPSLFLLHYSRGPQAQNVPPVWQGAIRKYPIVVPQVPPTFVMGKHVPPKTPNKQNEMARAMMMAQQQKGVPPRLDEDSDDEPDYLTKRELAKVRYMRNHEFMNDIFAWPQPPQEPLTDPWAGTTESDLEARLAKLEEENEAQRELNKIRGDLLRAKRKDIDPDSPGEEDAQGEDDQSPEDPGSFRMDVDMVEPVS